MKKLIIIVFAVLMLTVSAVFAQETELMEIKWEDIAEGVEQSGIEGDFYSVSDVGLVMWIPSVLIENELTAEDMADGMILFLASEEGDGFMFVNYMDLEGATLEDAYEGLLEEPGYEDVEMGLINGLKALTYTAAEYDMMGLSFIDENGYMIQFLFFPMSNEGFAQLATIMAASIQEGY